MTKHKQQADDEIYEDQLINFLVNALAGSFGVSLGENADLKSTLPPDILAVEFSCYWTRTVDISAEVVNDAFQQFWWLVNRVFAPLDRGRTPDSQ